MKKQTEYIVIANGRPFFSVVTESAIDLVKAEAYIRFGSDAKVEVFKQTTELYDPDSSADDNK